MNTPDDYQEERDEARKSPSTPSNSDANEDNELAQLIGEEDAKLIPPEVRENITRTLTTRYTSLQIPRINPVREQVTSEHISTALNNRERANEREHIENTSIRRYQFLYFLIGLLAAIALIVFFSLTDDRITLTTVIVTLVGFVGGFGVGRGTRRG